MHILLAEDNRADVLLVREALSLHRIECDLHVVEDGEEAIHFVSHMGETGEPPCPDVFLLDLNLPKADGPQVLRVFREHPQCAHTPVIVVTSSDMPRDREQVEPLGIARYFRKPADLDQFMELGAVVKRVMEEAN